MDVGTLLAGRPVYSHTWTCPALSVQVQDQWEARKAGLVQAARQKESGLPFTLTLPEYRDRFREALDGEGAPYWPHYRRAFAAAGRIVQELDRTGRLSRDGFFLEGCVGAGKSMLLSAFGGSLIERGIEVRCLHLPAFVRELWGSLDKKDVPDVLAPLQDAGALFLDDLGLESLSPYWISGFLYPLLEHRYQVNERPVSDRYLPTFGTTHLSLTGVRDHYVSARDERGRTAERSGLALWDRLRINTWISTGDGKSRRGPRADYLKGKVDA